MDHLVTSPDPDGSLLIIISYIIMLYDGMKQEIINGYT
jgi:hypothetical protein